MATQTLAARVDRLEQRVTLLEEMPARVDALTLQVSQLRVEMRGECSAVRDEIRAGDEETRRVLREEIRAGDERVMGQVRVLHEELISRLALIQKNTQRRASRRRAKR